MSRFILSLLAVPLACGMSSCMIMRTAEKGYQPTRVVQDGTAFEAVMLAEGEGPGLAVSAMVIGGGAVSLFGPYRLQITAYGYEGLHQTFEIRRFRFRFANGQAFDFGPEFMRTSTRFVRGEFKGEVVAVRKAWKVFDAKPKVDGAVTVEADVVILTTKGRKEGTLKFAFTPSETVKVESINVPWEVKRAIWKDSREHPVSAWAEGVP